MPKINRKHIYIALAAVLVLIIAAAAKNCGSGIKIEYGFEKASFGPVEKTVSATGILDVYEKQAVLSRIGGLISSLKVSPEQKIENGQVLAVIDSSEIDQKLLRLSTKLESSSLSMISAERKYNGKKEMYKEKLISAKDLEQSELEYKTEINNHKLLQIEQSEARKQKQNSVIVSPLKGVVVECLVAQDGTAGINSVAFYVAPTLSKMVLSLDIDESDIGSIVKGQKVSFTVSAFPDRKFSGEIAMVSFNPVKKGGLVTYQSTVICDNSELLLKPGMTATATVTVAKKENVLRVSNQAFIVSPDFTEEVQSDGPVVWKKNINPLQEEPADMVSVKTGLAGDMYTEVTENLAEGDQVLVKIRQVEK